MSLPRTSARWAAPVLRQRILVNYRAEAEGTNVETVIRRLLETVKSRSKMKHPTTNIQHRTSIVRCAAPLRCIECWMFSAF